MRTVNKTNLKILRDDINAALAEVARKHDIEIHAGNASYTNNNATFKLLIATKDVTGAVLTPEVEAFNEYKNLYDFNFGLNDKFNYQGERFEVVGYAAKSHKYPILAKSYKNGKTYKLTIKAVKEAFQK